MAATIKLTYDPKQAKQGLAELEKQVKETDKALDFLGDSATDAARKINQATKHTDGLSNSSVKLGDIVKQNIGGLGEFASVTSTLGNAAGGTEGKIVAMSGQVANLGAQAANAALNFGPLGLAIVGVTTAVGAGIAVWQSYQEEARKAAEAAEEAAEEIRKKQEEIAEQQRKRQIEDIRQRFDAMERYRSQFSAIIEQLDRDRRLSYMRETAETKTLTEIRESLLTLKREERQIAKEEAQRYIAGSTLADIEREREKSLERIRRIQDSINVLKERESKILTEQKKAEQEAAQERLRLQEKMRQESNAAYLETMKQIELQRQARLKAEAEIAAARKQDVDFLMRALSGQGGPIAQVLGGPAIAETEVARGNTQANPFARFNRAGGLQARQEAMVRLPAQLAANFGNAQRHARGDFSMDRADMTVSQMRGGSGGFGGGPLAAIGADTPLEQLAAGFTQRQIREQVAARRQAEIEQRRERSARRWAQWGLDPEDVQRRVDREFAGEERRARRGAFRGDFDRAEAAGAVGDLLKENAKQMRAEGRIDDKQMEVLQQFSKELEDKERRLQEQQSLLEQLLAVSKARQENSRKKAIKLGRGRL